MQGRFGRNSGLGSVVEERQEDIDSTVLQAVDGPLDTLGLGEQEWDSNVRTEDQPPAAEQKMRSGRELNATVEDEKGGNNAASTVVAADDMPPVATKLTEAQGVRANGDASAEEGDSGSSTDDAVAGSSSADEPEPDEEQISPQLSKQALEVLLDDLTGELVALKAFGGKVDDRARENDWLGRHTKISLAVFQAELVKTGKCTFNVDENGVLLDDPVKYRLALEAGAQITLRVHAGWSETQKTSSILLKQGRDRVRTDAENRELTHRIILAGLVQGLTYEATAEMAGVHANTVRNVEKRAAADPNSKDEITQRPDGRYAPETREKIAKAAELRKDGMADAEIAEIFNTNVETLGKWLKDPPARDKAKRKTKGGKGKKAGRGNSRMQSAGAIDDLADSDGVPGRHSRALKHLVLDASAYVEWLNDADEKAQQDSAAAAGDLEASVKAELYFTQRAEVEKSRQRQILSAAGKGDVEEAPGDSRSDGTGPTQVGDILRGIVKSIKPDEVSVTLPVGSGVIDTRDEYPAIYPKLREKGAFRFRVEGFDRKRETWKVKLLGQQTVAPAPGATAARSDSDDRSSPYADLAGRKAGPKEKVVI